MKPIRSAFIPVAVVLLFSITAHGQNNVEIPRDEFKLLLSEAKLELTRGKSLTLEVTLLKSKSYQKSKVRMGLSSIPPKGMTIQFDPERGAIDFTKLTISPSLDILPGTYSMIVNATVNGKTKGSVLTLIIL